MQGNTEKRPGRLAPVLAALGTVLVTALFTGSLLWVMAEEEPLPASVGIMAVYAAAGAAVIVGVLAAMVQRLREIKRGEEQDAAKY
jgi:crotonobetainyl-CoA:carnitine CoA-transferase CaiB-like acyl-CoA transferase